MAGLPEAYFQFARQAFKTASEDILFCVSDLSQPSDLQLMLDFIWSMLPTDARPTWDVFDDIYRARCALYYAEQCQGHAVDDDEVLFEDGLFVHAWQMLLPEHRALFERARAPNSTVAAVPDARGCDEVSSLPVEMWMEIGSHLAVVDLVAFMSASRALADARQRFWAMAHRRAFSFPASSPPDKAAEAHFFEYQTRRDNCELTPEQLFHRSVGVRASFITSPLKFAFEDILDPDWTKHLCFEYWSDSGATAPLFAVRILEAFMSSPQGITILPPEQEAIVASLVAQAERNQTLSETDRQALSLDLISLAGMRLFREAEEKSNVNDAAGAIAQHARFFGAEVPGLIVEVLVPDPARISPAMLDQIETIRREVRKLFFSQETLLGQMIRNMHGKQLLMAFRKGAEKMELFALLRRLVQQALLVESRPMVTFLSIDGPSRPLGVNGRDARPNRWFCCSIYEDGVMTPLCPPDISTYPWPVVTSPAQEKLLRYPWLPLDMRS